MTVKHLAAEMDAYAKLVGATDLECSAASTGAGSCLKTVVALTPLDTTPEGRRRVLQLLAHAFQFLASMDVENFAD